MASNGYPKVTFKAWRTLRARAAAAPSTRFTPSNVAALMSMSSPESARDNTVSPLRRLGLIDDDGALTERGNKWRVDASYGAACQEILDEIYPEELTLLADADGAPDSQQVKTWFDHKGFGDSNARQMAATYTMIASKEVPEALASEPKKAGAKKPAPAKSPSAKGSKTPPAPGGQDAVAEPSAAPSKSATSLTSGPNVHLDIQVHIPADASLEQIDKIFASMAKHLYKQ